MSLNEKATKSIASHFRINYSIDVSSAKLGLSGFRYIKNERYRHEILLAIHDFNENLVGLKVFFADPPNKEYHIHNEGEFGEDVFIKFGSGTDCIIFDDLKNALNWYANDEAFENHTCLIFDWRIHFKKAEKILNHYGHKALAGDEQKMSTEVKKMLAGIDIVPLQEEEDNFDTMDTISEEITANTGTQEEPRITSEVNGHSNLREDIDGSGEMKDRSLDHCSIEPDEAPNKNLDFIIDKPNHNEPEEPAKGEPVNNELTDTINDKSKTSEGDTPESAENNSYSQLEKDNTDRNLGVNDSEPVTADSNLPEGNEQETKDTEHDENTDSVIADIEAVTVIPQGNSDIMDIDLPDDLIELESMIETAATLSFHEFLKAGKVLSWISDRKLYKTRDKTFSQYCENRWGFSRRYGYDIIESYKIYQLLCAIAHKNEIGKLFLNESQLRPLIKFKESGTDLKLIFDQILEKKGDSKLTAKMVKKVVDSYNSETHQFNEKLSHTGNKSVGQVKSFKPFGYEIEGDNQLIISFEQHELKELIETVERGVFNVKIDFSESSQKSR